MIRTWAWVVVAALLAGCEGRDVDDDGGLNRPPPDAGQETDAGEDPSDGGDGGGGTDAGTDGGNDGGTDGGVDAGTPPPYTLPPLQTSVPKYELTIPDATMQKFAADPYAEEQPGSFKFDGKTYDVKVRLRGGSSRFYPKRSWRIEFPEGVSFDGRRHLNLVAEQCDRTLMVEKLAYDLLQAAGVGAPRAKYTQLFINGKYEGVYLDIERVDGRFTKRLGYADKDASIFRAGRQDSEFKLFTGSWQGHWERENNEELPDMADLDEFLQFLNRSSEVTFASELEKRFDLDSFLRVMAVDAVISNDIMSDAGVYLIHDRVTGVWHYVPWDYNNSASRFWPTYPLGSEPYVKRPIPAFTLDDPRVKSFYDLRVNGRPEYLPAWNVLATRVVRNPELRARYLDAVDELLERLFTEEKLHPRIAAMHKLIRSYVSSDPYVSMDTEGKPDPDGMAKFEQGDEYLTKYVTRRIPWMRTELTQMRDWKLGLALVALDPNQGLVTLGNLGSAEVDLSNLVLSPDLRRAKDLLPNLPPRTLAPGETLELNASELGISLGRSGEVGIFPAGAVWGPSDFLFYGSVPEGKRYLRAEDGEHRWKLQ